MGSSTHLKSKGNFSRRSNKRNHGVPGLGAKGGLFANFASGDHIAPGVVCAFAGGGTLAMIEKRLRNHKRWVKVKRFRMFA